MLRWQKKKINGIQEELFRTIVKALFKYNKGIIGVSITEDDRSTYIDVVSLNGIGLALFSYIEDACRRTNWSKDIYMECRSPFNQYSTYIKIKDSDDKEDCMVIVVHDSKILLAKRLEQGKLVQWNFPGGTIEYDETPIEAAIKKLKRETGLIADSMTLLPNKTNSRGYTFVCTANGEIIRQNDACPEWKYLTVQEVEQLELFPSTKTSLELYKDYLVNK